MNIAQPPEHDDGYRSYQLAAAANREICIRKRQILPDPSRPDEVRWAAEGERPIRQLETARRGL